MFDESNSVTNRTLRHRIQPNIGIGLVPSTNFSLSKLIEKKSKIMSESKVSISKSAAALKFYLSKIYSFDISVDVDVWQQGKQRSQRRERVCVELDYSVQLDYPTYIVLYSIDLATLL